MFLYRTLLPVWGLCALFTGSERDFPAIGGADHHGIQLTAKRCPIGGNVFRTQGRLLSEFSRRQFLLLRFTGEFIDAIQFFLLQNSALPSLLKILYSPV